LPNFNTSGRPISAAPRCAWRQRRRIVFSVADLKTHFEATDEVWDPSYRLGTEVRFLGPVGRKGE
jgi:hypothetical protein